MYSGDMALSNFKVIEHQIPTCHIREYPRATIDGDEDELHLAVKQYTPKRSFQATNTVTVIGAHANGFPKVRSSLCHTRHHPTDVPRRSCTNLSGTNCTTG